MKDYAFGYFKFMSYFSKFRVFIIPVLGYR